MKKQLLAGLMGVLLLVAGGSVIAQPARNVNPHRHPNLAQAQRLCHQAWMRISEAQKANEFDMEGHAAKAKDLLDQVNRELKIAAGEANENAH